MKIKIDTKYTCLINISCVQVHLIQSHLFFELALQKRKWECACIVVAFVFCIKYLCRYIDASSSNCTFFSKFVKVVMVLLVVFVFIYPSIIILFVLTINYVSIHRFNPFHDLILWEILQIWPQVTCRSYWSWMSQNNIHFTSITYMIPSATTIPRIFH